MARTVKAPDIRRNEILEVARQLFYARGYEQTSVQDIIDQVGIAKGTFYHYFGSKLDLLDELIERMVDDSMQIIEPIATDPDLAAPAKFRQLFSAIASWKSQSRTFLLDILRPYFGNDNAVLRLKMQAAGAARIVPVLACIIRQGRTEGVFATDYPEEISELIVLILMALSEALAVQILQGSDNGATWPAVERKVLVTQHAIERLLDASPGSLPIMDLDNLKLWFD
jgi:AcrR family transcriptional regulator